MVGHAAGVQRAAGRGALLGGVKVRDLEPVLDGCAPRFRSLQSKTPSETVKTQ